MKGIAEWFYRYLSPEDVGLAESGRSPTTLTCRSAFPLAVAQGSLSGSWRPGKNVPMSGR